MDVNGQQFGPRAPRRVTQSEEHYGLGSTEHFQYSKEEHPDEYSATGWATHLHLDVHHQAASAAYAYPESGAAAGTPQGRGSSLSRPQFLSSRDKTNQILLGEAAKRDLSREGPGGQQKLFGMGYDPGESKVDYMAGTRQGQPMAMTMLGLAQNSARRRGRNLTPSSDLSEHSSKLVGHLQQLGAVEPGAVTTPSNDLTFSEFPTTHWMSGDERQLPHEEVMAGRQTARSTIRQLRQQRGR